MGRERGAREGDGGCIRRLRYRQSLMGIQRQPVQGFETELVELPDVPLSGADRERMMRVVAAIVTGATPEEITGYLAGGFPEAVDQLLGQPLESEEMSAHVDVLLAAAA